MNILVLAPHTDDGELGCGGTISKLCRRGDKVRYIAFSHMYRYGKKAAFTDLTNECRAAMKILGVTDYKILDFEARNFTRDRQDILDFMIEERDEFNPQMVFIPMSCDFHQDHQTIAQESIRAFKYSTLLGYEIIWNNQNPTLNVFIDIDKSDVEAKEKALLQYKSQSNRPFYGAGVLKALARVRGVQTGVKFAEAFEAIRVKMQLGFMEKSNSDLSEPWLARTRSITVADTDQLILNGKNL